MDSTRRNLGLLIVFTIGFYAPLYWPYMFHLVCVMRGRSALEFGALKSIYYASVFLLELPGGLVADRLGRRVGLAASAAFNALGCFLYSAARGFWTFALAEGLLALGTALLSGADSALLYDSLRAAGRLAEYPRREGLLRGVTFVASAAGLLLSDYWLVPRGGPALTYFATGLLSLLGLLAVLAMHEPARERASSLRQLSRAAVAELLVRPRVLQLLAFVAGIYVLARAANSALYDPVLRHSRFALVRYGSVSVVISIAGALAAFGSARWLAHRRERGLMLALPLVAAALYAGLLTLHGSAIAGVFGLQGVLVGVLAIVGPVAFNREIESSAHRATLLSLQSMACRGSYALVSPLIGWCLDVLPLQHAVLATALLGATPLGLAWLLRRRALAKLGRGTV